MTATGSPRACPSPGAPQAPSEPPEFPPPAPGPLLGRSGPGASGEPSRSPIRIYTRGIGEGPGDLPSRLWFPEYSGLSRSWALAVEGRSALGQPRGRRLLSEFHGWGVQSQPIRARRRATPPAARALGLLVTPEGEDVPPRSLKPPSCPVPGPSATRARCGHGEGPEGARKGLRREGVPRGEQRQKLPPGWLVLQANVRGCTPPHEVPSGGETGEEGRPGPSKRGALSRDT